MLININIKLYDPKRIPLKMRPASVRFSLIIFLDFFPSIQLARANTIAGKKVKYRIQEIILSTRLAIAICLAALYDLLFFMYLNGGLLSRDILTSLKSLIFSFTLNSVFAFEYESMLSDSLRSSIFSSNSGLAFIHSLASEF